MGTLKVFSADNHNANEVEMVDLESSEAKALIQELFKGYSFILPSYKVSRLVGANVNSNNFKVGEYYLKTVELEKMPNLKNWLTIINTLTKEGIGVSPLLSNNRGDYAQEIVVSGEKRLALLQPFILGHYYPGTREAFAEGVKLIQRLYQMQGILSKELEFLPQLNYDLVHPKWFSSLVLNDFETGSSFDQKVWNHKDKIQECLNRVQSFMSAVSQEQSVFHCDLHPHNIFYNQSRFVQLLDLDSFCLMNGKVYEGFSFYKLARKLMVNGPDSLAYIQSLIPNDKREDLYNGASLELLRRLMSVLDQHYNHHFFKWDFDLDKFLSGLYELDIIFSRPS